MGTYMVFDPIGLILEIFNEQHPDLSCAVYWSDGIDGEKHGETLFPDDGSDPQICVDVNLPMEGVVEVLAHELAHVATPDDHDHGDAWRAAFDDLHKIYVGRVLEMQD